MPRHKFLVCLISVVIVGLQLSLQGAAISLPQNQKKKAPDSGAKAKSGQPKQERKDQGTDQNNEPSAGDSEEAGKDEAPERLLRERAKLILSLLSQEARQWEKKDVAGIPKLESTAVKTTGEVELDAAQVDVALGIDDHPEPVVLEHIVLLGHVRIEVEIVEEP
ncbi:MAG: hypothetical protein MN733_32015, partial [Nitrososphaera sp.]|nr:hypothetical protein [Nitrososphaera sp.]